MTKQEMLYEQYNDALFRLLMHSVAQHLSLIHISEPTRPY